jgi:hypothetical protein
LEGHYQLSDTEFEAQFADCNFSPTLFSHEAHVRLAWIQINNYGIDKTIKNICKQIQRFEAVYDDGTKFHKTLTVAAVKTVNHFLLKSETDNFLDFIIEFPKLNNNFKDLIECRYGFSVLLLKKLKKNT